MKRLLLVVLLCGPVALQAQSATSFELRIYQGGAAPISTVTITAFQCGQAKLNGTNVNPTRIVWDDPADTSKDCIASPAILIGYPVGTYTGRLVAINEAGTSAESNAAPFVFGGPPSPPSNFRFVR